MSEKGSQPDWVPIATKWPMTLNKDEAPELLEDGETPDAYGMGIDRPGSLCAGSIPTPTAAAWISIATDPTATTTLITRTDYTWYYWHERLWATKDTHASHILYGAHGYEDLHCPLGPGKIECSDGTDTGNVTMMAPVVHGDSEFVIAAKAASACVIRNTRSAHPTKQLATQAWGCTAYTRCVVLGGLAYSSLAAGVYSLNPATGQVVELTKPVRNNIGSFAAVGIDADYVEKRIIGDAKFVIQLPTGERDGIGLYDYGTSGFRWTSRTIMREDGAPVSFQRIAFLVEHTNTSKGTLSYQIKHENTWTKEKDLTLPYKNEKRTFQDFDVADAAATRRWVIRITALSSNLRIQRVNVWGRSIGLKGFAE